MPLLLLSLLPLAALSFNVGHYDITCEGHSKCYSLFDDRFTWSFWDLSALQFWSGDGVLYPHISWAESSAMAATFMLRYFQKMVGLPTSRDEYISAAHILLSVHTTSYYPDFINCTTPSEYGSYAIYFSDDRYLYNAADIPLYVEDYLEWCTRYDLYAQQLRDWNGVVRYNYNFQDFDDQGADYATMKEWLWLYGLQVITVPFCPDLVWGWLDVPNDKYFCDPSRSDVFWSTSLIYAVMEDEEGLWYGVYFMDAPTTENRLQWIRPTQRFDPTTITFFSYVANSKSYWGS